MTKQREGKPGRGFRVVCAWCGAVIAEGAARDSERMCAGCYARMLDCYTRPLQRSQDYKASGR